MDGVEKSFAGGEQDEDVFEDLPWEGEGRGCFEDGMVED